jgi:Vitamin B6 photo-protection and homoeostasis
MVLVMKRPTWSPCVPSHGRLGLEGSTCTPTQIGSLLRISTSPSSKRDNHDENQGQQPEQSYQVWGYPATDRNKSFHDRKKNGTLLYEPTIPPLKNRTKDDSVKDLNDSSTWSERPAQLQEKVLSHFLPADFPHSVAPGYIQYATYGFIASVAGSAGMILSTQTLLLAVGVVGSSPESQAVAPIMAGALNWVLKDGIGQFGGVLFASVLGQTRNLDVYPKQWRMVAAISLDCATFLELLSPMVPSWFVLPIASMATVGKNIGFLTASASRAALHQALAIRGNSLADGE